MMMYVNQYTLTKELAHQQALLDSAKARHIQIKRVNDEYIHLMSTTTFYSLAELNRMSDYMYKAYEIDKYARKRIGFYERRVNALQELLDTYADFMR